MDAAPKPSPPLPDAGLLQALLDALPIPLGLENAEGQTLYANPALLGLRAANPAGAGTPEAADKGPQRPRPVAPGTEARAGSEHSRVPLPGGGWAVLDRDLHEWHPLVQANLQVESLLRSAMAQGRMGYFLLDPARPDLGRDADLRDRFRLDGDSLLQVEAQLLAQPPGDTFDFQVPLGAGADQRWLQFRGEHRLPRGGSAEPAQIVGIVTDVSGEHRAQNLSRERAVIAAKSRMAAYISHEINNPLGGIKNASLLLRRLTPPTDQTTRYLDLLDEGVSRIQSVVQILSAIHRPLDPVRRVSLATLVGEIEHLIQRRLTHSQVRLDVTCPATLTVGDVYADLLRQILFNLLLNAIEASPKGGTVRVQGTALQEGLRVEVGDDGPGIPEPLRDAIWEPGFSTKRTTISGGLTLGLALCRELARSMGGDVGYAPATEARPGHFYCSIAGGR